MICTKSTAGSSFYVNAVPGKTQPKYLNSCKVFYGWLHKALLLSCTVLLKTIFLIPSRSR